MKLTRHPDDPITFLKSLRTVRFFEREPVSREALDDILEVARWSGSARNRQPWEFVVVRDRGTLETLAALEGYAQHLADAAVGIVLVMAGNLLGAILGLLFLPFFAWKTSTFQSGAEGIRTSDLKGIAIRSSRFDVVASLRCGSATSVYNFCCRTPYPYESGTCPARSSLPQHL